MARLSIVVPHRYSSSPVFSIALHRFCSMPAMIRWTHKLAIEFTKEDNWGGELEKMNMRVSHWRFSRFLQSLAVYQVYKVCIPTDRRVERVGKSENVQSKDLEHVQRQLSWIFKTLRKALNFKLKFSTLKCSRLPKSVGIAVKLRLLVNLTRTP